MELLDRQFAFLTRQRGADFIRQLRLFLGVLRQDPRFASHTEDIRTELVDFFQRASEEDNRFLHEAVALRIELASRAPGVDDSDMEPPPQDHGDMRYRASFAHFDRVVSGEDSPVRGIPLQPTGSEDESRSGTLLGILLQKLSQLRTGIEIGAGGAVPTEHQRPDLRDLERRVGNLSRSQQHWHRAVIAGRRTLPGSALAALEHAVEQSNPAPVTIVTDEDFHDYANAMFVMANEGLFSLFSKALYEGRLSAEEAEQLEEVVERLRALADRLFEDVRRRLGTVRTYRALVQRFKNRCEWHDRDRLRDLASGSTTPEDDLAAEFARWLFDQGLSPLTKARAGGLEPDILDPSLTPTVYVEAKRYRSSSNARAHIRNGVMQVHDTVARLHGTPYEVREAFLLVFREAGPRYALPESIRGEAWTVYPILVDIAPAATSGSRQRERIVVMEEGEFSDSTS